MARSPFIESIRTELRTRRYSIQTEKTYLYWVRAFILFNDKKHPELLSNPEIERFLNYLAITRGVSASTQNQALCALVFMYRHVIKKEIVDLNYAYARRPKNLPVVLSPQEVGLILTNQKSPHRLITSILFGGGLRISEALSLRVKDIDFHNRSIFVFRGKGSKDRYTLLPQSLIEPLHTQIERVKEIHKQDLDEGFGFTSFQLSPMLLQPTIQMISKILPISLIQRWRSTGIYPTGSQGIHKVPHGQATFNGIQGVQLTSRA